MSEPINSEFVRSLLFVGGEAQDGELWSPRYDYESRQNAGRTSLRINIDGDWVHVYKIDRVGWFGLTEKHIGCFCKMPRQDLIDLCRIYSIPTCKTESP